MTEETNATPVRRALDGYFAMWNETDPEARRRIIEEVWAPDARYIESLMAVEGHEGLNHGVAGLQSQYPDHRLRLAGHVDVHHSRVRWSWELFEPQSGQPIAGGTNVGVLAADGRLSEVTGFFDFTPELA